MVNRAKKITELGSVSQVSNTDLLIISTNTANGAVTRSITASDLLSSIANTNFSRVSTFNTTFGSVNVANNSAQLNIIGGNSISTSATGNTITISFVGTVPTPNTYAAANITGLAPVAISGNYYQLVNRPDTISQLLADSGSTTGDGISVGVIGGNSISTQIVDNNLVINFDGNSELPIDSVTNTSVTLAASANSVKRAYDTAVQLYANAIEYANNIATIRSSTAYVNAVSVASADATNKAANAYSNAIEYANTIATTRANTAYSNAISVAAADAASKANTAYASAVLFANAAATAAYTNAVSLAINDATNKASQAYANAVITSEQYTDASSANAYSNAVSVAAADATNKASQSYSNAVSVAAADAINKAAIAYSNAVSVAAGDATNKSSQAFTNAISVAAADATNKSSQAFTNAISVAAADATNKANQAYTDAITAAAIDANDKAANAYTNAVSTAALDATNKTNDIYNAAVAYTNDYVAFVANTKASLTGALFTGNVAVNSSFRSGNTLIQGSANINGPLSTGNTVVNGWLEVAGDTTITGNLVVTGTTITVDTINFTTSDNMLYLNESAVANITDAVGDGSNVTYTAINSYRVGMDVTVTGIIPAGFNITNATITAANATSFTVTNSFTDTYVSGGVARAKTAIHPDLGFAGGYNDGTYHHAGFFRDATDGAWKVFEGYNPEPEGPYILTDDPSFKLADFHANDITANNITVQGLLSGNVTNANDAARLGGQLPDYYVTLTSQAYANAVIFAEISSTAALNAAKVDAANLYATKSDPVFTGNVAIPAITANGSTGTAGQILTSNGTAVYWESPALANGTVGTLDQVLASGNATNKSLTVGTLTVNGSITTSSYIRAGGFETADGNAGLPGQLLTSNGSSNAYWSTPATPTIDDVLAAGNNTTKSLTVGPLRVDGSISANGSAGSPGQVLTSNGSSIYWDSPAVSNGTVGTLDQVLAAGNTTARSLEVGGIEVSGATILNGNAIANSNLFVEGPLYANGSTGSAGQVLTSNGTSVYWSQIDDGAALADNAYSNAVSYTNTQLGFKANTASPTFTGTVTLPAVSANGSTGTAGQTLTSNGSATYWSTPATGGFTNGQSISVSNVVVTNTATLSRVSANGSTGTAGQVLTTNGLELYWSTPQAGGNNVVVSATQYVAIDTFIANGTANTFTLTQNASIYTAQVYIDGLLENPSDNYTINGNTLAFVTTPLGGGVITVYHAGETANLSQLAATAYSNAIAYAAQIVDTAYTNAVAYAASNTYVNGTFAPLVSPTFTGTLRTPALEVTGVTVFSNNVTVAGNLVVTGTRTFVNTNTLDVGDNIITLNADLPSDTTPSENAGFEVNRGESANVSVRWNETNDVWEVTTNGTTFAAIATNTDVATAYSNAVSVAATDATSKAANAYSNAIAYASSNTYVNTQLGTKANSASPTFTGTVTIPTISANGSTGVAGQMLTSNGSGIYWSTPATGGFTNGQSISVSNVVVTNTATIARLSANGSTGTAGQILTSNGTAIYWESPAIANGTVGTLDQVLAAGNTTTKALTVGPLTVNGSITANGSTGTAGQILTSNGSSIYWSTSDSSINLNANYLWNGNHSFNGSLGSEFALQINGRLILNGEEGLAGQILATDGSGNVYWTDVSGGFTNGQSISVSNVVVTNTATVSRLSANGSTGTAGQVLTSNGTTTYWSTPATGGGSVNVNASYAWTNTHTFTGNTVFATGTSDSKTFKVAAQSDGEGAFLAVSRDILGVGNVYMNSNILINVGSLYQQRFNIFSTDHGGNLLSVDGTSVNVSATFNVNANTSLNGNVSIRSLLANSSQGTAGQVLTSNGSEIYWESPAVSNGSVGTLDQVLAAGNTTTKSLTVGPLTIGGDLVANNSTATFYSNTTFVVPFNGNTKFKVGRTLDGNGALEITYSQVRIGRGGIAQLSVEGDANFHNSVAVYGNTTFYSNANTTFIAPVNFSRIRAGGTTGTAGQVLTSNGSGNVYWSDVSGGTGGFANGQSISVANLAVTGSFTANGSTGSAGQILTSNGTATYWSTPVNGSGDADLAYANAIAYAAANTYVNGTFAPKANPTFTGTAVIPTISANGSTGSAGQVLTSDGTSLYWSTVSTDTSNGTNYSVTQYTAIDSFTGDGSTDSFTLSLSGSASNIQVFVNGLLYVPETHYTISNTSLTFVSAPANNHSITVYHSGDVASASSLFAPKTSPTFTGTVTLPAVSANGSTGSAGQVLTSNGTSTYWSTSAGGESVGTLDQVLAVGNTTSKAMGVGGLYVTGLVSESLTDKSGTTITYTPSVDGPVLYTSPSSSFGVDIITTGFADMGTNKTVSLNILVSQGSTPYGLSSLSVDGVGRVIKWAKKTAPSYTANSIDSISITLVYRSGSVTNVLASVSAFGEV